MKVEQKRFWKANILNFICCYVCVYARYCNDLSSRYLGKYKKYDISVPVCWLIALPPFSQLIQYYKGLFWHMILWMKIFISDWTVCKPNNWNQMILHFVILSSKVVFTDYDSVSGLGNIASRYNYTLLN